MKASGVLVALVVVLGVISLTEAVRPKWHELAERNYDFDQYIHDFAKYYNSEVEYAERKAIFQQRLREVYIHNKDESNTWKKGVNKFSDRFPEELNAMKGYSKGMGFLSRAEDADYRAQALTEEELTILAGLPESVDWRDQNVVSDVKDQGNCGSCWSFAAAETIESHWAIATGYIGILSEQNILDCTANPYECGGNGGCGGATCELAYQQIQTTGIASEWTYPYASYQGSNMPSCRFNNSVTPPVAKISGYSKLPTNKYAPLMEAVATKGPIAVTVDASAWSSYESGVFNGCNQASPDLDHAVQLVGYGTDENYGPYYLVRNSWGDWGEEGYIRLARPMDGECGTDTVPLDGTGCEGGPDSVYVCGTCGIWYDTSYPIVDTN